MVKANLKQKTVTGIVWSGFQKFGSTMLTFISSIVLARLLTPEDYGYIGMLTIFLVVAATFIDGGFGSALIQKKCPTREDYSTIFYWNFFLSLVLYIVLFLTAPLIADFYNLPLLSSILRVQGLVLIINAVRIVQTNQLRKQLKFRKIATVDLSVAAFSLAVTIFLAWHGWGVWALVLQQLLVSFLTTSIYWMTGHWTPLFSFSIKSFKELFNFGGFMLLSNLVNTISNNIQGLLIGRLYSPATMGYYSKARHTETLASTFVSSVIDQVAYPVLAEAQNDSAYMVKMLKKFSSVLAYVTFPFLSLLALISKPVFVLLYSDRWLASVPYFQLLCFAGFAICLQGISYNAILALGKSREVFRWTLIKRVVGIGLMIFGLTVWGIYGLLVGSVITSWVIYLINAFLVSRYLGYTVGRQLKDLMPIFFITILAFVGGYLVSFTHINGLYSLGLLQGIVFCTVYWLASKLFNISAFDDTKDVISILFNKLK